jgi:hypothetical protein
LEFTLDRGSTPLASTMINLFIAVTIFTNTLVVQPVTKIIKHKTGVSFSEAFEYIFNEEDKQLWIVHHSENYKVMFFCIRNDDWYVDLDKNEMKRKSLDCHFCLFRYLDLTFRYQTKKIKIY